MTVNHFRSDRYRFVFLRTFWTGKVKFGHDLYRSCLLSRPVVSDSPVARADLVVYRYEMFTADSKRMLGGIRILFCFLRVQV